MARDSVLIYGSGTMGCGIACNAALAGNHVFLYDNVAASLEQAPDRIRANLAELQSHALCTPQQAEEALQLIEPVSDLQEVYPRVKMVIEAVFENLAVKQEVFCLLDKNLPVEVPLLSNTSGLRITDIAAKTEHPERTLTTHFWLPAHLIPLVEVVIGDHSAPELAVEIKEMLTAWGKAPVIVQRDLPVLMIKSVMKILLYGKGLMIII